MPAGQAMGHPDGGRYDSARAAVGLEDLFLLVVREDSDAVTLAVELFREAKGLESLDVERRRALEEARPESLEVIVELMQRHVNMRG